MATRKDFVPDSVRNQRDWAKNIVDKAPAIFEWIEVFYNRERLHSALGFQSPVDFENKTN